MRCQKVLHRCEKSVSEHVCSAARPGNVNRPQRNVTPTGARARERRRERKERGEAGLMGTGRMESEGLACRGMRRVSGSGELPLRTR